MNDEIYVDSDSDDDDNIIWGGGYAYDGATTDPNIEIETPRDSTVESQCSYVGYVWSVTIKMKAEPTSASIYSNGDNIIRSF